MSDAFGAGAHVPRRPGDFGPVVTAMVTPFGSDTRLDLDGAVALASWLAAHGTDALVLAGTTGEAPALSDDEKVSLWRTVAGTALVPVIANTGTASTAHSVELTQKAAGCGVQGILAVTPYYNRPPQAGIEAHFRAVAGAAGELPVLLYDIPVRTGRKIAHEVLVRLAGEVPNIAGVKDATGDVPAAARLAAAVPDDFTLYSGEDALTLALAAHGAAGVISVASHWAGVELAGMLACVEKGDLAGARTINAGLLASFAFESSDTFPNPMPAKAACRVLGLPAGQCRLPLGAAPSDLDAQAARVIEDLGRHEVVHRG